MDTGSHAEHSETPSLSDILNKTLFIHSRTIINGSGKMQSFCGLRMTQNVGPFTGQESHSVGTLTDLPLNQIASTSKNPFVYKKRRSAETLSHRAAKKIPHGAAHASAGIPVVYHDIGPPTFECQNCKVVMWYQERTNVTKTVVNPTFSVCCQGGKVLLPIYNETPSPLNELMDYSTPANSSFKEQIRVYNGMFCYTSFGARIDHSINTGRGPYTFRVNGQSYHRIGSLLPKQGTQPKFAQLYFFDTGNELKNRMGAFVSKDSGEGVDANIVASLMKMFNQTNPITKAFRMARDWSESHNSAHFELRLLSGRGASRQYNAPTVPEIAALITADFGDGIPTRDIVVRNKEEGLKRISELHPEYMALQYPLLFPYGEDGYHEKILYHNNKGVRKTKRPFVTMKEYYSYIIQHRNNQGTTLLRGGRLFQQFLVDAYAAIEEQRLTWNRKNQDTLRVDLYHNMCDAVTRGDTNAAGLGKRIILPKSFIGGPRYMMQNYQDAMAICRTYGNPDLFITFTANTKWPEISEMLKHIPGQKAHDRPEVSTRVFKLKLTELLNDLTKHHIFGKSRGVVYVIEFQKRGLPHAHILLWLEEELKCKTPSQINDIITAEIPCRENDPDGYKVVTEFMLHGPCGKDAKHAPCTSEGKCLKHFPKRFVAETMVDSDGYAIYRRRDNKAYHIKGKFKYDNRYVVPHNRYLLLKYQAHINVEWCNRSKAIKYLFKYLNKGPDRATIVIQENVKNNGGQADVQILEVDEIKNYLNCRFLAPCEAVWRLFSYDIHYSDPSVIKLNYHLPNQHAITLRDSESLPALIQREGIDITMFTDWFELNKRDTEANKYTYSEIPAHYVWHEKDKMWKERKKHKCIGRIVYSHPASGERYYLRMLLNIVRGPRSFEKLMTVNDRLCSMFKEACFAYGLLNDDTEWTHAISEARVWMFGPQLRDMFVTILLFCDVSRPLKLWEENWHFLAEDILHKKRKMFDYPNLELTDEQLRNYCLLEIQELLNSCGRSLGDFQDLPLPDLMLLTNMDNRLIREALAYDMKESKIQHLQLHSLLNPQQRLIYEEVIESVNGNKGKFYFVYGPGGTGKTFLYKTIISRLRSERKIVLAVASSGISSLLLPGGRTAHSPFVIPLELLENSTCGIKQNTHLSELMQQLKLIIWDEAPMTQKYAFEALDKTLRDILGYHDLDSRDRIFGGVTVLLGGDFRQVLLVIPKASRPVIIQSCINQSELWKYCKVFTLTQSMRVNDYSENGLLDTRKQDFNKWVLAVGDGNLPAKCKEDEDEPSWIDIPESFLIQSWDCPIEKIVAETYPDFTTRQTDDVYLKERAILTPRNDDADTINDFMFKQLKGDSVTYNSADEVCKASTDNLDQHDMYPIEFLNSLNFPGMPPHELQLKKELPIMLLRNINPSKGLCNGTRLLITDLGQFVIHAKILTGSNIGDNVIIHRIILTSTQSRWPFILKRRQFPVRACYAMTINKSQGQSLAYVGLYLSTPVFTHGQLYVALSRVTTPDGLKILMIEDKDPRLKHCTRNIVFKEAFSSLS